MHEDLVLQAFHQFDQAGTGMVSVDDFRRVFGDSFSGSDLALMFKEADKKGDG